MKIISNIKDRNAKVYQLYPRKIDKDYRQELINEINYDLEMEKNIAYLYSNYNYDLLINSIRA